MEKLFPQGFESIQLTSNNSHNNLVAQSAQGILSSFAESLLELSNYADQMIEPALQLLTSCQGKLILSGVGKSGIVARKIAANFNCLGLPSIFLHPTEALHGDLGLITKGDVALLVSHSGETAELLRLLDCLQGRELPLIVISNSKNSTLAKQCQVVLETGIEVEACPHNFLPTSSSVVSMALGEVLSIAYMNSVQTRFEELKFRHPGGVLGQ